MEMQVVFLRTPQFVSTVGSRLKYYFLIFASQSVFDAELNSALNVDGFKRESSSKNGSLGRKTGILWLNDLFKLN
jgi:hypothetical protein